MPTAIEFENISKIYRLGLVTTGTLANDIHRWWTINVRGKEDPYLTIGETNDRSVKGESDYVWALKDISFKVEQGDVVGIIGKNGAGKSTLLKILSKITSPTTGFIRSRGRIGSLLEVGTGFHGEMTGRENIFLNGAILGMTKAEIAKKLDEIVDFSGCERYIDTPVKRYSSGMMVRLGFAVAAHLDPEILVVDEVLAVGDAEFQKKAIGKMQNISRGEGRTVLFVSHNMAAIRNLCKTGVLLNNGSVIFTGNINDTIGHYLSTTARHNENDLNNYATRIGSHEAYISTIEMLVNDTLSDIQTIGDEVTFKISVVSFKTMPDVNMGISIWNQYEMRIIHTNTKFACKNKTKLKEGSNTLICKFENLPLQIGKYYLNIAIYHNDDSYIDQAERAFSFSVIENDIYGTGRLPERDLGCLVIQNNWKTI